MEEEPHTPHERFDYDDTLQFFGEDTSLNQTSWMESYWRNTYSHKRKFRSSTPIKLGQLRGEENLSPKDEMSILSLGYEECSSTSLLNRTICTSDINFSLPLLKFKKSLKRKSYSPIHDHRLPAVKVTDVSPLSNSEDNEINITPLKKQNKNARVRFQQDSPNLFGKQMKSKLSNYAKGKTSNMQQSPGIFRNTFNQSLYRTPIKVIKKRRLELSGSTLKSVYDFPIRGLKCGNSPSRITKPEPFSFDERDKSILKKRIESPKVRESLFEFKAAEPVVLKKKPFVPEIKQRTPCKLKPPKLLSELRAENWQSMKQKRLERAQKLRELQEEAQRGLEADIRKVRKALSFKATPVKYKEPTSKVNNS